MNFNRKDNSLGQFVSFFNLEGQMLYYKFWRRKYVISKNLKGIHHNFPFL